MGLVRNLNDDKNPTFCFLLHSNNILYSSMQEMLDVQYNNYIVYRCTIHNHYKEKLKN